MVYDPVNISLGQLAIQRGLMRQDQAKACLDEATRMSCSILKVAYAQALLDTDQCKALEQFIGEQGHSQTQLEASQASNSSVSAGSVQVGQVLGGYSIQKLLGQGGMGAVFVARKHKVDYALKVILKATGLTDELRFEREAQAAAAVDKHPNIVSVHAFGREQSMAYMILDLVDGQGLDTLIERGQPWDIDEALGLIHKIGGALAHIHQHGIIHRDLKPANILIRRSDNEPLLTDFGLAKVSHAETLTKTGEIIGTPAYMPPEQLSGERTDQRADIWALGAMLFELTTGHRPVDGQSLFEICHKALTGQIRSPSEVNESYPRDLEALVMRCLQQKPEDRYERARDLLDDIERYRKGLSINDQRPGLGTRIARSLQAHKVTVALAVLIPILVLATVASLKAFEARRQEALLLQYQRPEFISLVETRLATRFAKKALKVMKAPDSWIPDSSDWPTELSDFRADFQGHTELLLSEPLARHSALFRYAFLEYEQPSPFPEQHSEAQSQALSFHKSCQRWLNRLGQQAERGLEDDQGDVFEDLQGLKRLFMDCLRPSTAGRHSQIIARAEALSGQWPELVNVALIAHSRTLLWDTGSTPGAQGRKPFEAFAGSVVLLSKLHTENPKLKIDKRWRDWLGKSYASPKPGVQVPGLVAKLRRVQETLESLPKTALNQRPIATPELLKQWQKANSRFPKGESLAALEEAFKDEVAFSTSKDLLRQRRASMRKLGVAVDSFIRVRKIDPRAPLPGIFPALAVKLIRYLFVNVNIQNGDKARTIWLKRLIDLRCWPRTMTNVMSQWSQKLKLDLFSRQADRDFLRAQVRSYIDFKGAYSQTASADQKREVLALYPRAVKAAQADMQSCRAVFENSDYESEFRAICLERYLDICHWLHCHSRNVKLLIEVPEFKKAKLLDPANLAMPVEDYMEILLSYWNHELWQHHPDPCRLHYSKASWIESRCVDHRFVKLLRPEAKDTESRLLDHLREVFVEKLGRKRQELEFFPLSLTTDFDKKYALNILISTLKLNEYYQSRAALDKHKGPNLQHNEAANLFLVETEKTLNSLTIDLAACLTKELNFLKDYSRLCHYAEEAYKLERNDLTTMMHVSALIVQGKRLQAHKLMESRNKAPKGYEAQRLRHLTLHILYEYEAKSFIFHPRDSLIRILSLLKDLQSLKGFREDIRLAIDPIRYVYRRSSSNGARREVTRALDLALKDQSVEPVLDLFLKNVKKDPPLLTHYQAIAQDPSLMRDGPRRQQFFEKYLRRLYQQKRYSDGDRLKETLRSRMPKGHDLWQKIYAGSLIGRGQFDAAANVIGELKKDKPWVSGKLTSLLDQMARNNKVEGLLKVRRTLVQWLIDQNYKHSFRRGQPARPWTDIFPEILLRTGDYLLRLGQDQQARHFAKRFQDYNWHRQYTSLAQNLRDPKAYRLTCQGRSSQWKPGVWIKPMQAQLNDLHSRAFHFGYFEQAWTDSDWAIWQAHAQRLNKDLDDCHALVVERQRLLKEFRQFHKDHSIRLHPRYQKEHGDAEKTLNRAKTELDQLKQSVQRHMRIVTTIRPKP